MKSHGIFHQTSCACTPQQNWVTERNNRHLVKTTHTLLIHGGVAQKFWGDVILSACYLINHIPSSVLNNKIPYSILFSHELIHISYLLNFLGIVALFIILVLVLINYLLGHTNV